MYPPMPGVPFWGVSPPPPALTLLWVSVSCTVALCLAISFTFPRTLWGGRGADVSLPKSSCVPTKVTAMACDTPQPPPHLQPGFHLVQHSHVQHVDLGLQDLHGLLGTRGEGVGPWECPPKCYGHRVGGGEKVPAFPPRLTHHEVGAFQPSQERVLGGKMASGGQDGGQDPPGGQDGGSGLPPSPGCLAHTAPLSPAVPAASPAP